MKTLASIRFLPAWRRFSPALLAVMLAGCTAPLAMQSSFNDYSEVYAETQNRQMLLNLARLHEGFPIYFFQLGQINASYTFTETAGLGGTRTTSQVGAAASTNGLTSTFSVGSSVTHNPMFTLLPLAGDKFATQLLTPISPLIFEQNFEQGWPVDQLMRILVERIEITDDANQTTQVFENNPWDGKDGYTQGYDHFLRACHLALLSQKAGILHLVHSETFEPLVTVTAPAAGPRDSSVADAISAEKDSLVFQKADDGTWQIGKEVKHSTFVFDKTGKTNALLTQIEAMHPYSKMPDSVAIFQKVLASGFSLSDKKETTNSTTQAHVRFVMRSLMGVITALATEQQAFEARGSDDPFIAIVPGDEWHPLLTLTWPNGNTPDNAVTAVNFQGRHYAIGDAPPANGGRASTWNRDVFRLLVQLSFQVTTDAANLPTTPVVSVRGG